MEGKKEDDVNVSNLTLRDSKVHDLTKTKISEGHGVCGWFGASIHLDNISLPPRRS